MGTAFHIGDGVMVTAKHVVSGKEVRSVATTTDAFIERADGETRPRYGTTKWAAFRLAPCKPVGAVVESSEVDVAAFRVELPDAAFPEILVEDFGPEWVADHLVMESAYVLGYPRIPSAKHAILVGLSCEVSAIVPELLMAARIRRGMAVPSTAATSASLPA